MRLYYQNPGQSVEFEIEGARYELQTDIENDIGDSLDFASELDHIRMGAKVWVVSDTGDMRFVGVVYSIEYSASGGQRRYNCIAAESLLSARVAPPIVYPGGAVLSNVISDDPPAQSPDYEIPFRMGLLWLARSGITAGLVSWSDDGIGTLAGWGPKTTGHDIYYNGHLCAEVGLSALDGGDYRCAFQGGNLYVRGTGTGDVYGTIAADGWNENFVRLGTIADDFDLATAYNAGEAWIWDLIRDLVAESGQYIVFRRETDGYVYLDVSASPKARGSEDAPFASLRIGDDFSIKSIKAPKDPSYSCILGLGAGAENVEGVRIGVGSPTPPGQAWIEKSYELADARLPPWGHLDQATEDYHDAIHQHAPVEIDLFREGLYVGDWIEIDLGIEKFTAQIRSMSETNFGAAAAVGAPDLSLLTAFWDRSETSAIEAYRDNIIGEYSDSDDITVVQIDYSVYPITHQDMMYYNGYIYIYSAGFNELYLYSASDFSLINTIPCGDELGSAYSIDQFETDGSNIYVVVKESGPSVYIYKYTMNMSYVSKLLLGSSAMGSHGRIIIIGDYIYAQTSYYNLYEFPNHLGGNIKKIDKSLSVISTVSTPNKLDTSGNRIDEGWQPYGMATDGTYIYISSVWMHTYYTNKPRGYYSTEWVPGILKYDTNLSLTSYSTSASRNGELAYVNSKLIMRASYSGHSLSDSGLREYNPSTLAYVTNDGPVTGRSPYICDDGTYIYNIYNGSYLQKITSAFGISDYDEINVNVYILDYLLGEPFEMSFTPDDFEGSSGLILFSLYYSGSAPATNPGAMTIFLVLVNDTTSYLAVFKPWGGGSIITDMDISSACALDGSEENIKVYACWTYDLEETCTYTGTVRGITKP